MERLIKKAVQAHLESRDAISPAQHGFRKHRSCISNLLTAKESWGALIESSKSIDVIFVDFSKAFDKVPHQRLLWKLNEMGITGKVQTWIADFLRERTMRVQVNDCISKEFLAVSGVPQGSVLGPGLFKIYINDLPETVQTDCLLYANDVNLWAAVNSTEDADRLQMSLDQVTCWTENWLLPVNTEKCAVLSIGPSQSPGAYHIGGYLLRNTYQEKDLGVVVTADLKTMSDTVRKAAAASRALHRVRRAFYQLTPEIFRRLFTSLVRPILEYGLPAAYPMTAGEVDLLERVQRRGSKWVTGLRGLEYDERLRALQLFPMSYRRLRGDLIYTRRILKNELGNDLKSFFQLNEDDSRRGHTWKLFKPRRSRCPTIACLSTRVINHWNGLPSDIIEVTSEACFKKLIDEHFEKRRGLCCSLHH